MLLDDDVMTYRQAKAGALTSRFGCEERVEHLLPHLWRNANTIVTNPDLHPIAEAFGRSRDCWLKPIAAFPRLAPGRGIKPIRNQVEKYASDFLGKSLDFPSRGVEGSLQRNSEPLLLGASAVVGEIEALLDESVDIDEPTFA